MRVRDRCDTVEIVPPDHSRIAVDSPDLPELELRQLDNAVKGGHLLLDGALVEHHGLEPVRADRTVVTETDLRGVAIDADHVPGLRLSDVVLRASDLSNVDGREGSLRRVEIDGSRLVGFGLTGGTPGSSVPTAKPKGSIFGPLAVPALAVEWDPAAVYKQREMPERTSMSQRPQLKLGTSDPKCPPDVAATTGSRSGLAVQDLLERMNEREKEDRG